ncbi:hypothetical protein [Acinetobacter seifertii]|uniref:hypothetical protein n=1 Tax=Acinetobacter seifertii TaxID=1530123 RepID=UPI001905A468|nr:hypothetical protein [Acinetobacter seifertii]MBJ9425199.1 hypothetical protein [Acinetobacter seifertii]
MNMACKNTGNWVEMCESLSHAAVHQKFGFHEQIFSNQILGLKRLTIAVGNSGNDKTIISHCPFCGINIATDYDYPAFIQQFGLERARAILFTSQNRDIDNWYDEETKTFSQYKDGSKQPLINVPSISYAFAATILSQAGGVDSARKILETAPEFAEVVVRTIWADSPEIHNYFYTMRDGVVVAVREGIEPIGRVLHSYEEMLQHWRESYNDLNESSPVSINKVLCIELADLYYALRIWKQENDV